MKVLPILLLLLPITPVDDRSNVVYSQNQQIQRVFSNSQRLRGLLAKTKAGHDYTIKFDENINPMFNGTTEERRVASGFNFQVHIIPGLSDDFVENELAHEIFHIYLRSEGFVFNSVYIPRKSQLEGSKELLVIQDAAVAMSNCYPDAIIDRRMEKLGYDPRILNRRKRVEMIEAGRGEGPIVDAKTFNLFKRYRAVIMYCTSLRLRDFDMRDIYAAFSTNPTLEQDVAKIDEQMGATHCKTANTCFQAMLKLRKVSGFDGEIEFPRLSHRETTGLKVANMNPYSVSGPLPDKFFLESAITPGGISTPLSGVGHFSSVNVHFSRSRCIAESARLSWRKPWIPMQCFRKAE